MERVARQDSSDHSYAHERGRIPARGRREYSRSPPVEASGVRLFSDHDSDQSTCIYVDSSLNSSIRSELNSSELNSSELNNSSTSTFSDFSPNDSFLDKLKC